MNLQTTKAAALLLTSLAVFVLAGCNVAPDKTVAAKEKGKSSAPAICRFDLSELHNTVKLDDPIALRSFYDQVFLVTSLQGLANRDKARLVVRYHPKLDDFWWQRAKETWLAGEQVNDISSLDDLLARFHDVYKGVVVYDETVPATSEVAASVAGAEDLLVLRYDKDPHSLYTQLTTGPKALPIKVRLVNEDGSPLFTGAGAIPRTTFPSTGSAKNDAYRWLIGNYLKPGRLNPAELAYFMDAFWLRCWWAADIDQYSLNNLDLCIARRGVAFDLDVFADEAPVDDPKQKLGTDFETLGFLLKTCNELTAGKKLLMLRGFVPWPFKYSTFITNNPIWNAGGSHDPVPSEWRLAQVLSAYNGVLEADALTSFPNASFYQHYPLPKFIPQRRPAPSREGLMAQGILNSDGTIPRMIFYAYYGGDYDAASWIYKYMPDIWNDPARGKLPVSWAVNPNLGDAFGIGLLWMRQTATENDDFVCGDCGAGYINPYQFSEPREFSALPSGVAAWEAHTRRYMRQWDLNVVGFVIDGSTPFMKPDMLDAYSRFSPGGICTQFPPPETVHNGMPMLQIPLYLNPNAVVQSARQMKEIFEKSNGDSFIPFRSILWKPSDFVAVEQELGRIGTPPRKLVDMRTLLWLSRYRADLRSKSSDTPSPSQTGSP